MEPVSLKVGERVGAIETPVTVMVSRKWSFIVIMPAMPMKMPLRDCVAHKGSRFMVVVLWDVRVGLVTGFKLGGITGYRLEQIEWVSVVR